VLYVGERSVATRSVAVPLDYGCEVCGFRSKVLAIGRGEGQAHNPYFLDTDAGERASDAAFYAAHRSAREAVALVCCPRCGGHDRDAWRWFGFKAVVVLSAILVAFTALIVFFALSRHSPVAWVLGVMTPFLLAVVFRGIRWRYKTAEARVAFDPPRLADRRRLDPTAGACFEAAPEIGPAEASRRARAGQARARQR
jgi:hypothetical protein